MKKQPILLFCGCGNNTPVIKDGVLPGKFAVADGKYVHFSQGNLQYQASTDTWRFAEHQWDFVGDAVVGNVSENGEKCDNDKISSSYSGWIDLFGWGTSGWNSGANAYQPWSISILHFDYYPGGNSNNGLTDEYANADWGVYNKISNGGNKAGLWRTLTIDEWQYIFEHHTRGQATVNGVHGYVLLPAGWSQPSGVKGFVANPDNWTSNDYSIDDWCQMEKSGAVFLPCAGFRFDSEVSSFGQLFSCRSGHYWSASFDEEDHASCVRFDEDRADADDWSNRSFGLSVRLVHDF